MKTYNILIIEIKEAISDIITAKQGDTNSRFLDVYLRDNGRPVDLTGNEVKIYGRKEDGKAFFNNGEITDAVNGRCQFELTNQALAVAGNLALEISIWQNNKRTLTTQTFHIFVSPKIRDDKAIESSNEFNTLVVIFQKLDDFIKDASELIDRIGLTTDTGGTSSTGTVMAKLNKLLTDWTTALAGKIDTINTYTSNLNTRLTTTRAGYLDKLVNLGAVNDTGGTSTAGTVTAKLNKLLTDWTTTRAGYISNINTYTSNLNSRLTSTRAGYLDKLANFGATGDTGGSATAGTMMAKLNKLLSESTSTDTDVGNINTVIGKTTDTGGTSTAGTVMAKLNKLLTDWTTTRAGYISNIYTYTSNVYSRLTATRAGYLDKLANFGAVNDTGGTSTAGTVMAKLNKLLTDWTTTRAGYITNLNSRLTSTRAGYLDKLANFGATGDTGGSATAGTMMAKLNAILTSSSATGGWKIKSVQSGYVADTQLTFDTRAVIINAFELSKSILISDTGGINASNFYIYPPYKGKTITATGNTNYHVTQKGYKASNGTYYFMAFNWSIIEFY